MMNRPSSPQEPADPAGSAPSEAPGASGDAGEGETVPLGLDTQAIDVPSSGKRLPREEVRATRRRVLGASFIGNFVEWFDYGVYGYFSVVIAKVFFPDSDPSTGLMLTFGVFAISFIVRPIGGFFWGSLGDRLGRRVALAWSILLMSLATFLIALIPGYAQIGVAAPLLLLVLRVVQGFSASGEYAGASAFLVEYAPARKRGIYAAVVPGSTAAGLLLGSLIAALLSVTLSEQQLADWGWRLPFLLAAPLGLIGRYIRTKLEDTPAFQELAREDKAVHVPVRNLFTEHARPLLLSFGAVLLNAVGFYVILSYMPTYLSETVGIGQTESFLATTLALATYIGFIFLTGAASDRWGRKRVLIAASVCFLICTVPAFMLLDTGVFIVILLVQILLGGILTLNDGTLPSFLSEQFPTNVRYSGFAVSFNLANALFGGTAPFVSTLLIERTGNHLAPGFYLAAAALVSLIAVACARETAHSQLRAR